MTRCFLIKSKLHYADYDVKNRYSSNIEVYYRGKFLTKEQVLQHIETIKERSLPHLKKYNRRELFRFLAQFIDELY